MKKFIIIPLMGLLLASCAQKEKEVRDYAVVHGKISNATAEVEQMRIFSADAGLNIMSNIDAEGNFRDTIRLEQPATFNVFYDNSNFYLFLENGMDVEVNFAANNILETVTFKGEGEKENNSILKRLKTTNEFFKEGYENIITLEANAFNTKVNGFIATLQKELDDNKNVYSPKFIESENKAIKGMKESLDYEFDKQIKITKNLSPGMPSPKFVDYLDYKGGTKSLDDFKGKYVYIDVWATWCGPCMYEIPFMNKLEEKFKNSNIQFISISIDTKEDEPKWRKMIADKNMDHGTQLLADANFDSSFVKEYFIDGIPRFILLDPQGNIINQNAPRPSDEKTVELFKSLGL